MSSMDKDTAARFSGAEVHAHLSKVFPQIGMGRYFIVEETACGYARLRMLYRDELLRPGGTISGPSMFTLADVAVYAAVLASLGWMDLAVTSNMTINFLRKPAPCDMIGEAKILKLGKRLAFAEVSLFSVGETQLAAHATVTYALPQDAVL